jgi:uncharacterized protein (DUF58 family)
VLRHRLVLSYDALADGVKPDEILDRVLEVVAPAGRRRWRRRHEPRPSRRRSAGARARRLPRARRRIDTAAPPRGRACWPATTTSGLGSGTAELAQLRPYEAGRRPRRLDPAASARTGVPHVRLQVPRAAITTWLVLDVSPPWPRHPGRG